MVVQFLGWQPDLRRREVSGRGGVVSGGGVDERAALERALEDQAWERMFKEKKLAQRGELTRETEKGRGERAKESQERLISANEKLMFRTWWRDAPEEARQTVLDSEEGRKVVEDSLGFIPPAARVEKEFKAPELTPAKMKEIEKGIKAKQRAGESWWDSIIYSRAERQAVEKEMTPYREAFRSQWPGVGETREKGGAVPLVRMQDPATGEVRFVTEEEARRMEKE